MDYKSLVDSVLKENKEVLDSVSNDSLEALIDELLCADNVVCFGAGRMGLSLRSFSMRLNHLGIKSGFIGDTYLCPVTKGSIFLAVSGSGRTSSVLNYASIAKSKGARVVSIVGDYNSSLANLSDFSVVFKSCNGGLHSLDSDKKVKTIQPMSTLNEQAMLLLLDIIALMIIQRQNIKPEDFVSKHFNIE